MMRKVALQPIRRIFVPTDFSDAAGHAIDYAAYFANKLRASLVLFHSIHIPVVTQNEILEVFSSEDQQKEILVLLDEIKKSIKEKFPLLEIEVKTTVGFAVDEINRMAVSQKADLIIMGTKGAGGLKQLLIGSNTADVMQKSPLPVLAVPVGAKMNGMSRTVFATNYLDNDFQSLFLFSQMMEPFKSEITILHVDEPSINSPKKENGILEWFKDQVLTTIPYDHFSFGLINGRNVASSISSYAEENEMELIVLSMRKRNYLQRLFERSVTKEMANRSSIPILAFHS